MRLTSDEKAMLDGKQGHARQKAMELLVKYGEALGAERLVDTHNVCAGVAGAGPFVRDFAAKAGSIDAVFSEFNLDSREAVEIPKVKAFTCHLIQGILPVSIAAPVLSRPSVLVRPPNTELQYVTAEDSIQAQCSPFTGTFPTR